MTEELVPVFRVTDAYETAKWYARLGFVVEGEHRFGPEFPVYMFLRRGPNALHLSEHQGDVRPNSLVYLYVNTIDDIAGEFEAEVVEQPWAREIELTDPDGNRLRIGQQRTNSG
ncbi:MAG: glyoxalase superfamily protein [Leptolyngbyaceae cyanobacterium]